MSKELLKDKRKVTTADAIKALRKNNIEITEKQVEEILDFFYFLAKLSVNQYVNSNKSNKL